MQLKATVLALRKREQSNSKLVVELNKATAALQNAKMQTADLLAQQHYKREAPQATEARMAVMLRNFESDAKSKLPSLQRTQGNQPRSPQESVTPLEENEADKPDSRTSKTNPGESHPPTRDGHPDKAGNWRTVHRSRNEISTTAEPQPRSWAKVVALRRPDTEYPQSKDEERTKAAPAHIIELMQGQRPRQTRTPRASDLTLLYFHGMPRQPIREIKSLVRAVLSWVAVLCIDFIGGSVLELLTHKRMAEEVESTLQEVGLKIIPDASPLKNLLVRAQKTTADIRAMANARACARRAERIAS